MSGIVTVAEPPLASLIITEPPCLLTVSVSPVTVLIVCPSVRSAALKLPCTTWYDRILANCVFIDGFIKSVSVAEGNLLNAALVGANTVNGPAPLARSARPAATRAFNNVEWSDDKPALAARSLPVEVPIDEPDEDDMLPLAPDVPDMDDIPLVAVCEVDVADPVVCERGVVVVPL